MTLETLFTDQIPAGENADGAPGLDLGSLFYVTEAASCIGVQVWIPASEISAGATAITVGLYANVSQALLAGPTSITGPTHGFNNVTFPAPVDLDPNVTYIATFHTALGYAATSGFWDSSLTSGLIVGAASGDDVPGVDGETLRNGRLNGGTSVLTYPAGDSGGHACYFVGPVLSIGVTPPEEHSGTCSIALHVLAALAGRKQGVGRSALTLGLTLAKLGHKGGSGVAALDLAIRLAAARLRLRPGRSTAGGSSAQLAPSGLPTSTLTPEGE